MERLKNLNEKHYVHFKTIETLTGRKIHTTQIHETKKKSDQSWLANVNTQIISSYITYSHFTISKTNSY